MFMDLEMRFMWIFLTNVFVTVEGWSCKSTVTKVFSRVNTDAVLQFDLSAYVNQQTLNKFNVQFYDNAIQAIIIYKTGNITFDKIPGVQITADISGNVLVTKENIGINNAGIYYIDSSSTPTTCSCLYILGTPTQASVSATSSPSVGGSVTLTCTSTSATTPSNHSLGFMYNWQVDLTDNPSDSRYSYSTNKNTLTLSNIVRDDANKQFTCTATEDVSGGYTSSRSDSMSLDVHYGPDDIDFSPNTTNYERNEKTNLESVTCKAQCNPECSFRWNKVGNDTVVANSAVLTLGSLSSSMAGRYRCRAMRTGGSGVTKDLTVNVIYGPTNMHFTPSNTTNRYNVNSNPPPITCVSSCWLCEYRWTGPNSYSVSGPVLDLDSLQRSMHGRYTCTATNTKYSPQTQEQKSVAIEVRFGPGTIVFSAQSPIGFTEGDIAHDIRCSAECYPGCSYIWTNVTDSSRISSNNSLSLGRVNRFMTGSYMCTVNNTSPQYPRTAENIIEVIVTYTDVQSFYIKEHPGQDNVTVDEHDVIIEFKCVVDSNTASKTKLTFEGNLIKEGVNVTTLSAIRQDVSCYDAGVYTCEGINDNGKISSKKVLLSVRCVPRPRDKVQRNVTCKLHSSITLSFTAIAYPEPNPKGFAWYKDEDVGWVPLLSNNYLKISSSGLQSNLSVLNVSKEDYGNYRVTVTNDIGTYVQHFILYGKMSPDHTNSQYNCQQLEQTALIVGVTLGVVCCVLASVAFYLNILRMRTYAKDEGSLSRHKKHSTYANRSFASNVIERHEYENPETDQGEGSNQQQYTDLSRYANTDKDTYDVIRKT